jgi:hypothetical protein
MVADSGAMSAPQLIPETGKSVAPIGGSVSSASGGEPKAKGRTITMKFLFWSMYIMSAFFALIYCILCFFTYQEFIQLEQRMRDGPPQMMPSGASGNETAAGDATTLSNVIQDGAVMVDVDALSSLFRGAAVNGGIILFSVVCFYVVSSVLLLCSCTSLAHPRKKFNRGVCCGGSFWLMLETLNSALQFQSYQGLVQSLTNMYDTNFNHSMIISCFSFGYISALMFLILSVCFVFWKERVVRVES